MRRALRPLALLAAAAAVPACSGGDSTEPFRITFVSPANGTIDVGRQPIIYVRFDRALNPSTVNDTNFVLANSGGQVARTVTYEPCLNEVRITATAALVADTIYQVTVMNGVVADDGSFIGTSFFQFRTVNNADDARPSFGGVTAASNITQTTVDLAWTAGSDPAPGAGVVYDVFVSTTSGCFNYAQSPHATTTNGSGVTVTALTPNTPYYFAVRARDTSGNTDLNTAQQTATTQP